MTTPNASKPAFFEAMYSEDADPWNFATSPYELGRYKAVISALGHRRYRGIFEPGCSIGVLTELLADLGDRVVAIDLSSIAVSRAASRCAHLPGVEVLTGTLAQHATLGGFDLVVLSEIGYYFSADEWEALSSRMVASMDKGATLLAAHWLGHSDDHCLAGDEVHQILHRNTGLSLEHEERHPEFRIDRWVRV